MPPPQARLECVVAELAEEDAMRTALSHKAELEMRRDNTRIAAGRDKLKVRYDTYNTAFRTAGGGRVACWRTAEEEQQRRSAEEGRGWQQKYKEA
jgi:Mg-chelatase subunit ChlI